MAWRLNPNSYYWARCTFDPSRWLIIETLTTDGSKFLMSGVREAIDSEVIRELGAEILR